MQLFRFLGHFSFFPLFCPNCALVALKQRCISTITPYIISARACSRRGNGRSRTWPQGRIPPCSPHHSCTLPPSDSDTRGHGSRPPPAGRHIARVDSGSPSYKGGGPGLSRTLDRNKKMYVFHFIYFTFLFINIGKMLLESNTKYCRRIIDKRVTRFDVIYAQCHPGLNNKHQNNSLLSKVIIINSQ